MATFTAVLVVPDELEQDDLIEQLEQLGTVAFCGPESLVELPHCTVCGADDRGCDADECRSM